MPTSSSQIPTKTKVMLRKEQNHNQTLDNNGMDCINCKIERKIKFKQNCLGNVDKSRDYF